MLGKWSGEKWTLSSPLGDKSALDPVHDGLTAHEPARNPRRCAACTHEMPNFVQTDALVALAATCGCMGQEGTVLEPIWFC